MKVKFKHSLKISYIGELRALFGGIENFIYICE